MFLGLLNGSPAGYILAGSGFQGILRRWQVCIQYDARRRLYGAMLVDEVEQYGEDLGCTQSIVHVASDLEANEFWESVGYRLIGTEGSGAGRKYKRRCINVWHKPLFPAVPATTWKNGRPRIYESHAARQRVYALRKKQSAMFRQDATSTFRQDDASLVTLT